MAKVQLNPMSNRYSGRIGNIVLYYNRGNLFARSYVVPRNPNTVKQRENRSLFAHAVKAWQSLSMEEKVWYNTTASRKRHPLNGYNLFISEYMTATEKNNSGSECITGCNEACTLHSPSLQQAFTFDAAPLLRVYRYNTAGFRAENSS